MICIGEHIWRLNCNLTLRPVGSTAAMRRFCGGEALVDAGLLAWHLDSRAGMVKTMNLRR